MKSVILLLTLAATLGLTWAQREVEGFVLLGPVPRSISKFYYISTELLDWNSAFESCVAESGHLATPLNPLLDEALRQYMVTDELGDGVLEIEFVENILSLSTHLAISAGDYAWAGGKSVDSNWRWLTTNQEFTYQMFTTYHSCKNVDSCLHVGFMSDTLEWFWCGFNCTEPRKYVCEL